jgi:hypothetical protein
MVRAGDPAYSGRSVSLSDPAEVRPVSLLTRTSEAVRSAVAPHLPHVRDVPRHVTRRRLVLLAAFLAGTAVSYAAVVALRKARTPPPDAVVATATSTPLMTPATSPAVAVPPRASSSPTVGAATSGPVPPSAPPTTQPSGRVAAIRTVQTGLARAGCYDGPVNGYWTARTKTAMAAFVAVLNARLPVDQPDPVLVALVEANPTARCDGAAPTVEAAAPAPAPTSAPASTAGTPTTAISGAAVAATAGVAVAAAAASAGTATTAVVPPAIRTPPPPVTAPIALPTTAPPPLPPPALDAPRTFVPKDMLDAPSRLAAAPVPPAMPPAATDTSGAIPRGDTADPDTARPSPRATTRRSRPRRGQAAANNVSRQIGRNFRALQRSLRFLFN